MDGVTLPEGDEWLLPVDGVTIPEGDEWLLPVDGVTLPEGDKSSGCCHGMVGRYQKAPRGGAAASVWSDTTLRRRVPHCVVHSYVRP